MQITELYEGVLETLGLEIDPHTGVVSKLTVGGGIPVTVKDKGVEKVLVVPYKQVLDNPDWNRYIAYHPISENVARKDSPILKYTQAMGALALNYYIGLAMSEMIRVCANVDEQRSLNHKQNVVLAFFQDADEKAVKTWAKIEDRLGDENVFVKIVTMRNRDLNGQTYVRTSRVMFPFYNECVKLLEEKSAEMTLFGVKVRKKDVTGFKALMEYLLPHIADPDHSYSYGTRSTIAPSYHAWTNAFYNVMKDVNKVFSLLRIEGKPNLKWHTGLSDFTPFRGLIPPLPGNEGDITEIENIQQQTSVQAAPVIAPVINPVVSTPVAQPVQPVQPVSPVPAAPPIVPAQPVTGGNMNPVLAAQTVNTLNPVLGSQPVAPQPVQQMQPVNNPVPLNPTGQQTKVLPTVAERAQQAPQQAVQQQQAQQQAALQLQQLQLQQQQLQQQIAAQQQQAQLAAANPYNQNPYINPQAMMNPYANPYQMAAQPMNGFQAIRSMGYQASQPAQQFGGYPQPMGYNQPAYGNGQMQYVGTHAPLTPYYR